MHLKKYAQLLLAIAFLFSVPVYGIASNISSIKGKIVDSISKLPIDSGEIILLKKESNRTAGNTVPEKDGQFLLSDISDGEYSLVIRAMGFDIYTQKDIVLKNSAVLDLGIIALKPLEYELEGVVVISNKRQIVYKLDKKVIEAANNMQASGGTAVDILENTPSIQVNAEGELTFRGSSGFIVYVDGKPAVSNGSQALEQIPSGLVDNIEIITTPSARYETGSDVGIINVITKKHTQNGLSGMVNLTGSTVFSREIDFLISKQARNVRWHAGGIWDDRIRKSDFDQQKTTLVNNTSTLSHSNGPRSSKNYNYSLKTGGTYFLPKTTVDTEFEGGYYGKARRGELDYTEERTTNGTLVEAEKYLSYDDYDNYKKFIQGTVGFAHKFNEDGHNLSGSFVLKYDWHSLEYFQSDLFDKQGERQQGHRAWEDEYHVTVHGKLDYINPYNETGRIEAGYQYYSYLEDGDYSMQFWNPQEKTFYWREDIYNTFYFQRGIHSMYTIWGDRFKNLEFQAGLRGEHTHRVLRSSKEWANRVVNRFELFPSVHLGYVFPNEDVLMASYSRRTTRPDLFYMEPYITFRDYYSAEIGNPDIRPEYIHSFEWNYKKNIKTHSFSTTVFYRNRKDKIERLRIPYEAGITLDSMANVGHDYSLGLELFSQIQAARWWNVHVGGSYYRYKVENEYKIPGSNDGKSNNYEISIGNMFDVLKNTRIQIDGYFVGPSVTTQGKTNSFRYINLAVRQQLFNRKLVSTLSFRDVLNSARYRSDINTSNLQSITYIRPDYPLVTLTLSYAFNNYKTKTANTKDQHDLFEGTNH